MTTNLKTDVVVVGAGPVGLFAVFELGMLKIRCHLVDSLETVGGQCAALYPEKPIYDIPGYPEIMAGSLVEQLSAQAAPFASVSSTWASGSTTLSRARRNRLAGRQPRPAPRSLCRAVVIAAGAGAFGPNRPPLPGIRSLRGQGRVLPAWQTARGLSRTSAW